jgi:GNAT superfamily N-acetyltransferase
MKYRALLDDGTCLMFRLIMPSDKDLMMRAFGELSERSRYERFFSHLKRLSETQLRYLTEVDHRDHSAWVAIAVDGDMERGVGVGRWVRVPDQPEIAEVAITVIDEFHRRGIGRTLLYLAAGTARTHGIRFFRALVLGDNRARLDMFELMGASRGAWQSGVVEVTVPLDSMLDREQLLPLKLEPLG